MPEIENAVLSDNILIEAVLFSAGWHTPAPCSVSLCCIPQRWRWSASTTLASFFFPVFFYWQVNEVCAASANANGSQIWLHPAHRHSGPVMSFSVFFLFSGLLGDIQLRQAPALFAFRADSSITRQQQQQQLVSAAVLSQVLLFWCVAVDLWDQAVGLLPTVVVVVVVCLPHIFIPALSLSGWPCLSICNLFRG